MDNEVLKVVKETFEVQVRTVNQIVETQKQGQERLIDLLTRMANMLGEQNRKIAEIHATVCGGDDEYELGLDDWKDGE